MRRLTDTDGLTEVQRDILRTVRDFVDAEVIPVAPELEHADVRADAAHREGTAEIQKMIIGRALVRDY
jgi:alkylation response protein AidB-like acyl-CoA dehydrogenase